MLTRMTKAKAAVKQPSTAYQHTHYFDPGRQSGLEEPGSIAQLTMSLPRIAMPLQLALHLPWPAAGKALTHRKASARTSANPSPW